MRRIHLARMRHYLFYRCGQDVVEAIVHYIDRDVPILIHSVNSIGRQAMATRLRRAGFSIDVIPMTELTADSCAAWIADVRKAAGESAV